EIDALTAWIDRGAAFQQPLQAPKAPIQLKSDHWSFQLPTRPAVPRVNAASSLNPIDAFLEAERAKRGLAPLPASDQRILLRRVYLDLIGVPPTRDEFRTFLADKSPDAYVKVVDRLLADSRYGERWGRHWM